MDTEKYYAMKLLIKERVVKTKQVDFFIEGRYFGIAVVFFWHQHFGACILAMLFVLLLFLLMCVLYEPPHKDNPYNRCGSIRVLYNNFKCSQFNVFFNVRRIYDDLLFLS